MRFPRSNILLFILVGIELTGCIKTYILNSNVPGNYLVVEGYISTGPSPTIIRLSRSQPLSQYAQKVDEPGAAVFIRDNQDHRYPLSEVAPGNYEADSLSLDTALSYQVFIQTSNGEQYQSDLVKAQYSPGIDSVSWALVNGSVQLYASTHDSLGISPYYRWEWKETWEYQVSFYSEYLYINGQFVPRTPEQQVHTCWLSDSSDQILMGAEPNVPRVSFTQVPLTSIPPRGAQLDILYSIGVTQYAMSQAEYNYWQLLAKTSEQNGTIFDPTPVTTLGNLHCLTHPGETVIGYIGAGQLQQGRLFIAYDQLPPGWSLYPGACVAPSTIFEDSYAQLFGTGEFLPIYPDGPYAFFGAFPSCADCTTNDHGSNVKPSFWP